MAKSFEIWLMEHIQGINVYDFTRIKLKKIPAGNPPKPGNMRICHFSNKTSFMLFKAPTAIYGC